MSPRRFLVAAACLAVLGKAWSAEATAVHRLPHKFSPRAGIMVTVEAAGSRWLARWPDGRQQDLGEVLEEGERERSAPLLQADFNYDGHADIALIAGVGYGGALATYRLYLWDEPGRQFRKFGPIVGNPTLQPARKALIAWERDGPAWNSTEYRSDNGQLTIAVERSQNILGGADPALDQLTIHLPQTGKVTDSRIVAADAPIDVAPEALPSASARITKPKAWLHNLPKADSRTRMYLVQGDTVTLQHYQAPRSAGDNGFGWLFVRYQGRGKPLELWIDAESIVP